MHMFCELMRLQKRLSRMAQGISIIFNSEPTHLSFLFAKKGNFRVFLVTGKKCNARCRLPSVPYVLSVQSFF